MYALLAAALACVGASAGGLFFSSDRSLLVSFAGAMNRCALRFPVTGYLSAHVLELDQCRQAAYRTEGWWVLGPTAAVPLITAGLVFIVPWLDRWRLARAGRWADIPGATARFGLLCDQAELTDRLRPRLQVAGLALSQAFTTVLPGGRPLVVIPVKTALSHRDPQRFDPVLLHELAHVRARDVSWVSVVRGLALVTVPALALASVPTILDGGNLLPQRTFLIQAGAFVACSLLLAAALLRRREIDADRQAVRWLGSPAALRRVLDPAATLTHPKAARWRLAPLARHPSLTARITALRDPLGARDTGFAYALAVGTVTAMVINTSYFITWTFDISLAGQVPIRVSAAAGGLMLGLALTPALLRRAARARDAGIPASWWQPAAGTALGLFLGSLIPPGSVLGATITFFVGQSLAGVAIAGILAFLGAGVVALTAGLAGLAAAAPARGLPAWVTPSMTMVMSCCAAAALLPVPSFNFSQAERLYLVFVLPDDQWRWLALLYPAAAAVLAARICLRRGLIRAGAASLITPVLAATVTAMFFFPNDHVVANSSAAAVQRVGEELWWAATFAGLAVLIVLVLSRGVPGLARGCISAWLTTLLVGVERAIYGTFTDGWRYFGRLPSLLATPSVWLFYLAVLASCLALVRIRPPAPLRRPWTMPAAASTAAAAAAVAVFTTGIPGLFVPLVLASRLPRPTGAPVPPGVLTDAAARAIITRVGEALPDNWTSDSPQPSAGPAAITPAACMPFLDGQYLNVLPRPLIRVQGQYKLLPGYIDGTDKLKVVIASYARPVPAAMFTAAERDVRACPRYTLTDPAGSRTGTVREVTVHGLPVPAWRAEITVSSPVAPQTQTLVKIAIGHNLVTISQVTDLTGALAQPDNTVINAVINALTPASPAAPPRTPLPSKAVQTLTQAAAEGIAGAVARYLGSTWAPGSLPAPAPAHVTYQPADCAALAHEDYLNALPRPVARAENRYKAGLPDDGLETLSIRVEAFSQPVPASLLTGASRIFRACPRYTTQASGSQVAGSNGPSFVTTHAASEPGLGFPAWHADISTDLDPGSASVTWIMITAGHNFILISQQTISPGSGSRPDEKVITAAVTATIDALDRTVVSQDPGQRTGS